MTSLHWSIQQAMGLSDDEARQIEIRAARIEAAQVPDGAAQYVPITEEYTLRDLRSKTLDAISPANAAATPVSYTKPRAHQTPKNNQ